MGSYNTAVITTVGQALLTSVLGAQGTMTFTKLQTSSYAYASGTDLSALTSLNNVEQEVSVTAGVIDSTHIYANALISNTGVSTEYNANTLGIFASDGVNEVLFAVSTAVTPDVIPVDQGGTPSTYKYKFTLAVSSTSDITITSTGDITAADVSYDNTGSGLSATTVKGAIDELAQSTPKVTVGMTYELGSGAHTGDQNTLKATCLEVNNNKAVMVTRGLYGGTYPGDGEFDISAYVGRLNTAIDDAYLCRAQGGIVGPTTTTPTGVSYYDGSSWKDGKTDLIIDALYEGNITLSGLYTRRAFLATTYSGSQMWAVNSAPTPVIDASADALKTNKLAVCPTFVLDLSKVTIIGSAIFLKGDGLDTLYATQNELSNIVITGGTNTSGVTIKTGACFVLNGDFVEAAVDIANGATFTLNTNFRKKSVAQAINRLTTVELEEYANITSYNSSDNQYTCPYDGYVQLNSQTTASGNANVLINNVMVGIQVKFSRTYECYTVFVRKGMKVYSSQSEGANARVSFYRLDY